LSYALRLILVAPYHTNAFSLMKMSSISGTSMSASSPKHSLYDVPVSNNGARCRVILYKKDIKSDDVTIVSPMELGGLKSEKYLALNPQGKMPLLTVEDGMSIPESDTICRYLMYTYSEKPPSFLPNDTKSNLIARIHDMYLTTIQGCMYKASPPFGMYGTRQDALAEFQKQLGVINDLIDDDKDGLYLVSSEVSLADATLFPTMVFAKNMLPKFGIENPLPNKIAKWYDDVKANDPVFSKVHDEVYGGIEKWESGGRWDSIWLAGIRDEEPATIFDKIIAGEIPSTIVKDTPKVLAFKDINPAAPAHLLVIAKDRNGLSSLRKSSPEHIEILGNLLEVAGQLANDESLGFNDGARIVINDGKDGGQEVPHLHLHVLGGRQMDWPPG